MVTLLSSELRTLHWSSRQPAPTTCAGTFGAADWGVAPLLDFIASYLLQLIGSAADHKVIFTLTVVLAVVVITVTLLSLV